jgi:tetratricopeptide (TPR) repeat protein
MPLHDIQLKQKQLIETEIHRLMGLQYKTEQKRDVAASPTDQANYELQIESLKLSIEKYKGELQLLENETKGQAESSRLSRKTLESYRVRLDDSLSDEQLNTEFTIEVKDLLDLMDYDMAKESISGMVAATLPTFIAIQEGDFEPLKTLFQCVYGIADENTVLTFKNIYELNRHRLGSNFGIIITNTYIAPTARSLASQYQIQMLTFEDLLNTVFKVNRYLKAKCRDYEQNNKLYRTYVEAKYLRKGKGKFKDGQATDQESLVAEAIDGGGFESKGDLTPYVDSWLLKDGDSQICLLGEYGTGKTSFVTQYFYKHAMAYLENPLKNRIPLLVTLNRYHKSADIEQMMTDFLVNECGIRRNFNTFLKLAARGKLLIILDGFDEMAKQVDVNIRRHNFREIAQLLVGDNKVILSGRPNYFLTKAEIDEVFSQDSRSKDLYREAIRKATSTGASQYEILTITLFDRWQIEDFLKKQSEYLRTKGIDDWRDLQKTINETYNLEELARTPVLLEIIIKTISEIRDKVSYINAAKLYQIYTDFWLDREYDEKGDIRWLVTRKEKELFILNLAWTMLLTDNLNPEIHFSKLSEQVRNYFQLEKATEIEYFSSDIRFCSYLTHSEIDGNYKFIHKSFMEYFSARRIYQALFDEQDVSEIVTDKAITDEVLFFLCQMISLAEVDLLLKLSRKEKEETSKKFIISLSSSILQQAMSIYQRRGAIQSAEEWADKLLLYSEEFRFDKGWFLGWISKGKFKAQLGQYAEAEECYQQALLISERMGDKQGLSQGLIQLGTISISRGEVERALEYYQQALTIFVEIGDKTNTGQALGSIGILCQNQGDHTGSLEYYQKALTIFVEINDKANTGQMLERIGTLYQNQGDYTKSLDYYQQALATLREIGDRLGERSVFSNIGKVYQLTGMYEEAAQIFHESLVIAREIGDQQGVSRVLLDIGYIYSEVGRFEEAESFYMEALFIAESIGDQKSVAQTLGNIGDICQQQGRYEDAVSSYQRSISISERLGDVRSTGVMFANLAGVYSVLDRLQESEQLYRESLIIFEQIGDLRSTSIVMNQLGRMLKKTGDLADAERLFRKALEINERIDNSRGVEDILQSLGDLAEGQQDFVEAERLYSLALEISLKIADQRGECELSVKLGKLARNTGNTKKTIEYYSRYLELARKMNLSLLADVLQEYDQLKAGQSNLFNFAMPVRDEVLFYGRNRELGEIYRLIQREQNIMLVGERRMGKTSLLLQLHQRFEIPFISVLVDLQAFPIQTEGLLNGIFRKITKTLLKQSLISPERWEKYSLTYARDFIDALESMLSEAKEKLKDIKIVLILDEAERLVELGEQVGGVLRAVLSMNRDIVAIIAGTSQIEKMSQNFSTSPFLNIFTRITLQPLSREDTENLIREPSTQAGLSYEPDALERIYELSGGIPFYAQAIGAQLVELANQESRHRLDVGDVNRVIPEIFEQIEVSFQHSLYQLNNDDKKILAEIIVGNPLKDNYALDLQDLAHRQLIVKENGSYRFVAKLFEEWFKQHGVT